VLDVPAIVIIAREGEERRTLGELIGRKNPTRGLGS
jgi:hypothetical protein